MTTISATKRISIKSRKCNICFEPMPVGTVYINVYGTADNEGPHSNHICLACAGRLSSTNSKIKTALMEN